MQTSFSICDFVAVFSEVTIFWLRNADITDGIIDVQCPCVPYNNNNNIIIIYVFGIVPHP